MNLAQTIFYVVSPLVTLLAVSVAYLALVRQSRPQILIQYRPNPDIQSLIDLVVENVGGGLARNVAFSQPLPAKCFGIEKADGPGIDVLADGVPAIAARQRYVFDGGQYAGLLERIGGELELTVTYQYQSPLGSKKRRKEVCVLSVTHLQNMPTRTSAEQMVVDALKGQNNTTLKTIQSDLKRIATALEKFGSTNA